MSIQRKKKIFDGANRYISLYIDRNRRHFFLIHTNTSIFHFLSTTEENKSRKHIKFSEILKVNDGNVHTVRARHSDGNLDGNDENGNKFTLLSIKCIQM